MCCSYCCTSMEGADSGSWICDWCRVAKKGHQPTSKKERRMEIKSESFKEPGFSATSNKDHALELLLKAALTPPDKSELASPQPRLSDPMQGSPVTDCGSNCSSSLESEKLMSLDVGSHSCSAAAEASSSCENRMVLDMNTSDEEGSLGIIPRVHRNRLSTCDIKRSPNSLRCSVQARSLKKLVKQKSLPGSRNHVSSSIPVPSKRLSSLKSMPHTKSVAIIDSPKGLVRRYKSLSDISYWAATKVQCQPQSISNHVVESGMPSAGLAHNLGLGHTQVQSTRIQPTWWTIHFYCHFFRKHSKCSRSTIHKSLAKGWWCLCHLYTNSGSEFSSLVNCKFKIPAKLESFVQL